MNREKTPAPVELAAAIASRLREFRKARALRLEDVAAVVRPYGLMWDVSVVAKIEHGQRSLTNLGDLVILCLALKVKLKDWIPDEGELSLGPGPSLPAESIKRLLGGEAPELPFKKQLALHPSIFQESRLQAIEKEALGQAEQKAAAKLTKDLRRQITPIDVAWAAWRLWDMSLTNRRDQEVAARPAVGMRSLQANRGHITRRLQDELKAALKKPRTHKEK